MGRAIGERHQRSLDDTHEQARQLYWPSFKERLEKVGSFVDARILAEIGAPPVDASGRAYHSNLGFFLQSFTVPIGANREELELYSDLITRIAKELNPGVAERVQFELAKAMQDRT